MSCANASDWLELRDGSSSSSKLLKKMCGQLTNAGNTVLTTSSNSLYIHMHTDAADNDRGFMLRYNGMITLCIEE